MKNVLLQVVVQTSEVKVVYTLTLYAPDFLFAKTMSQNVLKLELKARLL